MSACRLLSCMGRASSHLPRATLKGPLVAPCGPLWVPQGPLKGPVQGTLQESINGTGRRAHGEPL